MGKFHRAALHGYKSSIKSEIYIFSYKIIPFQAMIVILQHKRRICSAYFMAWKCDDRNHCVEFSNTFSPVHYFSLICITIYLDISRKHIIFHRIPTFSIRQATCIANMIQLAFMVEI